MKSDSDVFNTMYTQEIVLEEVTRTEFTSMKQFWHCERLRIGNDSVVSTVHNPVIWPLHSTDSREDYIGLLNFLLEHPHISQIAVNDHGRWKKYLPSELQDQSLVKEAATFAANDSRKRYYLEAKYSTFEGRSITVQTATIEFIEFNFGPGDRRIVGFQTIVPQLYQNWFSMTISQEEYFNLNHGIWMPPEYTKNHSPSNIK